MLVNKRISLDADKSIGYGHLIKCCDKYQPIHIDELKDGFHWTCVVCEKPILINIGDQFFLVGDNVTI